MFPEPTISLFPIAFVIGVNDVTGINELPYRKQPRSLALLAVELNTGVMLLRNTDWTRQFIDDVARLGRMHVNHWQLMDQVSLAKPPFRWHAASSTCPLLLALTKWSSFTYSHLCGIVSFFLFFSCFGGIPGA